MNYICIFSLIFLGIMGTVSCIKTLGEMITSNTKPPPNIITCCSKDSLECRARTLLSATKGDVIILIPDDTDKQSEYYIIAKKLSEENDRIRLRYMNSHTKK